MYSQAALAPQGEQNLSLSGFFFAPLNNLFLYFLNTLFIGVTLAAIQGEYTNEMLQIHPNEYDGSSGSSAGRNNRRGGQDQNAISGRTFTRNCKSLVMWMTTWMPLTWIQVIDRYGEDEDELRKLDELLDGPNQHNDQHGEGGGHRHPSKKSNRA